MRGDIGWPRPALSARLVALNIGTRVIDSIPAATTTSCVPDMTACAANWIACCDDPHCRSIDTAGTLSGNAEARTALRPIWKLCRSEEHTSELQSLMRISYAVFCLKKNKTNTTETHHDTSHKHDTSNTQ